MIFNLDRMTNLKCLADKVKLTTSGKRTKIQSNWQIGGVSVTRLNSRTQIQKRKIPGR